MYGDNIETKTSVNIYKVSVRIYFESEGKITPPSTAIMCRHVTGPNVLFRDELESVNCDSVMPAEEKGATYFLTILYL